MALSQGILALSQGGCLQSGGGRRPRGRHPIYKTNRLEGLSQQLQYHEKSHTQIFISYEKNMISPDILNEYGILKYWRFKDDMLVLATSKPAAGAWFGRFRIQSDLFSMSCTACSRSID